MFACFIAMVLNYNLTNIGRMHVQGTALQSAKMSNMSTLSKMVRIKGSLCVS